MICEKCRKETDEEEPYGWCEQKAFGVHDSACVTFETHICRDCRITEARLLEDLPEENAKLQAENENLRLAGKNIIAWIDSGEHLRVDDVDYQDLKQALKGGEK